MIKYSDLPASERAIFDEIDRWLNYLCKEKKKEVVILLHNKYVRKKYG